MSRPGCRMSPRISRRMIVIATLAGVAMMRVSAFCVHPLIVWNATASAPLGFYRVLPAGQGPLRMGDLVVARLDASTADLYARRGYLPLRVPLLKRIGAASGQLVCERGGKL